jgi:hypothetical protein
VIQTLCCLMCCLSVRTPCMAAQHE